MHTKQKLIAKASERLFHRCTKTDHAKFHRKSIGPTEGGGVLWLSADNKYGAVRCGVTDEAEASRYLGDRCLSSSIQN